MGRSFWKGKSFIKDFVNPAYNISCLNQFNSKLPASTSQMLPQQLDDLKIYRRNHILLETQKNMLSKLTPFYLYTGYDFLPQTTPNLSLANDLNLTLNLAGKVSTRELEVTHKVKLSKAARKNNAKLVKKKSLSMNKTSTTSAVKRKGTITKRLRK